ERQLSVARAGLEKRVEERTRELAAAVRVRDEFLSIAGHELKTPLTTLVLQMDSLRRPAAEASPALQEKLEKASASVRRLTALVDELLDVSRIASGALALQLEGLDLAEVVREVCAGFHDQAARAGTPLRLQSDGEIPVFSDRTRVIQIVANLLANAAKYGPGKPVDVVLSTAGPSARLTVRDYGIGID